MYLYGTLNSIQNGLFYPSVVRRNYKFAVTKLSTLLFMKRLLIVFLFVFPALKYSTAQTFQAGFYGGASVSDIPGTDNVDNDVDFQHLGFTLAGTVSTKISPKTTLQMEIRFIQKGAQQS